MLATLLTEEREGGRRESNVSHIASREGREGGVMLATLLTEEREGGGREIMLATLLAGKGGRGE